MTIGVGIPALNEASTIGPICSSIHDDLVRTGVIDELLVIDPGSQDDTAPLALAAGARVKPLHPEVADVPGGGKGAALWSTLAYLEHDIVVWIDGDLETFSPEHVVELSAPILEDPDVALVKGFYGRGEGGRITELTARPLLTLLFPELSDVIHPLAGEAAVRRSVGALMELSPGYAVEIGLLIDVWARFGREAIAQVDLGTKIHRKRDLSSLGVAAHEIARVLLARAEDTGRIKIAHQLTSDFGTAPRALPPVDGGVRGASVPQGGEPPESEP